MAKLTIGDVEFSGDDVGKLLADAAILCALEDSALIIRGLETGKLPACFKPTREFMASLDYAITLAKGRIPQITN